MVVGELHSPGIAPRITIIHDGQRVPLHGGDRLIHLGDVQGVTGQVSLRLSRDDVADPAERSGRAAADGITAALLARAGFTGPKTIFEGKKGFFRSMADPKGTGFNKFVFWLMLAFSNSISSPEV